jgi:gluconate 5-dehydrogenase
MADAAADVPPGHEASVTLFDLRGKLALVTGSSRGLGLGLARALASAGARVVLNARDPARVDAAARELEGAGYEVRTAVFDVSDAAQVTEAVERIERDVGPIDILVNCAGIQHRAPLDEISSRDWDRLRATNLDGVFHVSQAVARHMIARRRGKIINVCSVQSEIVRAGVAPYAAMKGAVKMLTKGMCADWARHGLQINGIGPGYFATDLTKPLVDDPAFSAWLRGRTPAGRWGAADDLAGACIFLASAASDFVNGQVIYVDGGLTSVV